MISKSLTTCRSIVSTARWMPSSRLLPSFANQRPFARLHCNCCVIGSPLRKVALQRLCDWFALSQGCIATAVWLVRPFRKVALQRLCGWFALSQGIRYRVRVAVREKRGWPYRFRASGVFLPCGNSRLRHISYKPASVRTAADSDISPLQDSISQE